LALPAVAGDRNWWQVNVDDIEDIAGGLKLLLRQSKTDQAGEGRMIGIPYGSDPQTCVVRCLPALD
jgi:hypothetical protein